MLQKAGSLNGGTRTLFPSASGRQIGMSEHIFPVRDDLPPHMVVKLGWSARNRYYFMAYLGEGSDDPQLWAGGTMEVSNDPLVVCLAALNYSHAIPSNFAHRLEADRKLDEGDWMTEPFAEYAPASYAPIPTEQLPETVMDDLERSSFRQFLSGILGR